MVEQNKWEKKRIHAKTICAFSGVSKMLNIKLISCLYHFVHFFSEKKCEFIHTEITNAQFWSLLFNRICFMSFHI